MKISHIKQTQRVVYIQEYNDNKCVFGIFFFFLLIINLLKIN